MPENTASFNRDNVLQFERQAAAPPVPYEIAARALAGLREGIRAGDRVLEIRTRTGISTIILAASNPDLKMLTGVEPTATSYRQLADYKFGKGEFDFPQNRTGYETTIEYIERQRALALPLSPKVELVDGWAPGLPVEDGSVDKVYVPQTLHWLAFKDEISPHSRDQLSAAVGDVARVLRPGGTLFFDSNGHIFNFGSRRLHRNMGPLINDMHYVHHPLSAQFDEEFNGLARERGFEIPQPTTENPDKLAQIFDLPYLKGILDENGLKLMPVGMRRDYLLTLVPVGIDRILSTIQDGTKMHAFNHPGLKELPEGEKDNFIEQALQRAQAKYAEVSQQSYYETFISFAAQKMG